MHKGSSTKSRYKAPEAEVIIFSSADIITASDEAGHVTASAEDTRLPRM